jgi:hypothetical protein
MHRTFLALPLTALALVAGHTSAQQTSAPVSLTIYNQNFAVARTTVDLALTPGTNEVTTTEVTSQLEPDSVVLRDPTGKHAFSVVEQNYDAAIVNQDWLLQKYEGQSIDFQTNAYLDDKTHTWIPVISHGKILRASPPLVEVDGKMQFQLPGTPLFPATTNGLLLKPTLRWQISADRAASFPAELSYVTGGFTWSATYNLVANSGTGGSATEPMDIVGWITMQNNCGVDFPAASIKLIAGNVAKIQNGGMAAMGGIAKAYDQAQSVQVTQENFDDFHLYDLNRTTSLHNGETKQVEFLTANAVPVTRRYEFEPSAAFAPYYALGSAYTESTYGTGSNNRVMVVNEFTNSTTNHLGIPLPAGRLRLYRRDKSGAMQFAGEASIEHTPRNEKIRFVTGDAFDITARRIQTNFHISTINRFMDESFSIEVKNQKDQLVTVHLIEHLYRAANWEITEKSAAYTKRDSSTIELPVEIKPESSTTVTYTVHYTW